MCITCLDSCHACGSTNGHAIAKMSKKCNKNMVDIAQISYLCALSLVTDSYTVKKPQRIVSDFRSGKFCLGVFPRGRVNAIIVSTALDSFS